MFKSFIYCVIYCIIFTNFSHAKEGIEDKKNVLDIQSVVELGNNNDAADNNESNYSKWSEMNEVQKNSALESAIKNRIK